MSWATLHNVPFTQVLASADGREYARINRVCKGWRGSCLSSSIQHAVRGEVPAFCRLFSLRPSFSEITHEPGIASIPMSGVLQVHETLSFFDSRMNQVQVPGPLLDKRGTLGIFGSRNKTKANNSFLVFVDTVTGLFSKINIAAQFKEAELKKRLQAGPLTLFCRFVSNDTIVTVHHSGPVCLWHISGKKIAELILSEKYSKKTEMSCFGLSGSILFFNINGKSLRLECLADRIKPLSATATKELPVDQRALFNAHEIQTEDRLVCALGTVGERHRSPSTNLPRAGNTYCSELQVTRYRLVNKQFVKGISFSLNTTIHEIVYWNFFQNLTTVACKSDAKQRARASSYHHQLTARTDIMPHQDFYCSLQEKFLILGVGTKVQFAALPFGSSMTKEIDHRIERIIQVCWKPDQVEVYATLQHKPNTVAMFRFAQQQVSSQKSAVDRFEQEESDSNLSGDEEEVEVFTRGGTQTLDFDQTSGFQARKLRRLEAKAEGKTA